MNKTREFITLFNCMDGRCQHAGEHALDTCVQGIEDAKGDPVVDTITEPGIDAILAGESTLAHLPSEEWLRFKAEVSAKHHGATHAVVAGHHGCAGNPVEDDEHVHHIQEAVRRVRSWGLFKEVSGIFIDSDRNIQEVSV